MIPALATLAMKFGPDLLRGAGHLLGLTGRKKAVAEKLADIIEVADGDENVVEHAIAQLPPEDRLAFKQVAADLEKARMKHEEEMGRQDNADRASGRDVWKHDVSQEDLYTKRARPTGLYLFYLIILIANAVVPTIIALKGGEVKVLELPEELWWTFSAAFLGYSALRSKYDKQNKPRPNIVNKALGFFSGGK